MICRKCNEDKPEAHFRVRRDSKSGRRRTECRSCLTAASGAWHKAHPEVRNKNNRAYYERNKARQRARSLEWSRRNPDKVFDTHMRRTFGISASIYAEMLQAQDGRCAVCRRPETAIDRRTGKVRRLHVDHNHATRRVRSLLCTRCNLAVGFLGEAPDVAEAVAAYLRAHEIVSPSGGVRV
jgi:hypothetical protein